MTQIIGIVCKESVNPNLRDAIIMACESQYTIGDEEKTTDAQKLSSIRFNNRQEAMIAQAGNVTMSARAVRIMGELAKDKTIESEFTVARIAEEAVIRVRSEILGMMQPRNYSIEEQNQIFYNYDFALMIGHFYEIPMKIKGDAFKKPYNPRLWTIGLSTPFATAAFPYAVLGSGSMLARFILGRVLSAKIKWELAIPLAIHVIEQVKGSDLYCAGAVRIGNVTNYSGCSFYTDNLVNDFVEEIRKIQRKLDARYASDLISTISKIAKKRDKAYEKWEKEQQDKEREWSESCRKNNPLTVIDGSKTIENKGENKS
jgi:hypothetical protein